MQIEILKRDGKKEKFEAFKIEDAIKKENETCLESYSTFKVLEISPKKEFDVSTRVAFDMDENWEDFNKSFDSIVNDIIKGNNE